MFDNRYGTGQSTLDGIIRATNILIAGKNFVVAGYGWCGRGLASRARGMGAQVIVTEIDPLPALEAVMDGFRVMPMAEAAKIGDIFCTVTGDINVIDRPHMEAMKDGAIVANSGHFNDEINLVALLRWLARRQSPFVEEFGSATASSSCWGRPPSTRRRRGHPASVMDMSFARQALSAEHGAHHGGGPEVSVPRDRRRDRPPKPPRWAQHRHLTDEQQKYLTSWESGT
jgi:adenosylhomocysteinase